MLGTSEKLKTGKIRKIKFKIRYFRACPSLVSPPPKYPPPKGGRYLGGGLAWCLLENVELYTGLFYLSLIRKTVKFGGFMALNPGGEYSSSTLQKLTMSKKVGPGNAQG